MLVHDVLGCPPYFHTCSSQHLEYLVLHPSILLLCLIPPNSCDLYSSFWDRTWWVWFLRGFCVCLALTRDSFREKSILLSFRTYMTHTLWEVLDDACWIDRRNWEQLLRPHSNWVNRWSPRKVMYWLGLRLQTLEATFGFQPSFLFPLEAPWNWGNNVSYSQAGI